MEIAATAVIKIVVLRDMCAPSILGLNVHVGPIHKGLNGPHPGIRRWWGKLIARLVFGGFVV